MLSKSKYFIKLFTAYFTFYYFVLMGRYVVYIPDILGKWFSAIWTCVHCFLTCMVLTYVGYEFLALYPYLQGTLSSCTCSPSVSPSAGVRFRHFAAGVASGSSCAFFLYADPPFCLTPDMTLFMAV